ncbi:hypothetical protein Anas_03091, partial [Armadillidium nasatum]
SFSWGTASSHTSTFSSTSSSNPCGGSCLRFSPTPPQPPPLTLYLPPHLSTYPPVNPPPAPPYTSTTRDRSHSCPQTNHTGASRINEEVDCPLKGNSDERARGTVHFSVSPYYQRVNHPSSGVSGNKGLASASGHQNQDSSPKLVSPTSPYKRVSYKGAGGFPPESAALSPPKSKGVGATAVTTESDELGSYWQLLDDDLKPTMPQPSCPHSQQIFNEHNELAHQLLVVQEEIVYLDKKKSQMLKKLEDQDRDQQACRQRYSDKISQLKNKNESLRHDHSRLSHQLEEIRSRRQKGHHQQQQQQQSMQNQSSQQQQQQLNNQRLFHHHHHQLSSSTHLSSSTSPSSQYPHLHIPNQPSPHHSHQSQPDHSQQHQYVPQRQQQQTQQYYYDNHHLYPHYTQNQ